MLTVSLETFFVSCVNKETKHSSGYPLGVKNTALAVPFVYTHKALWVGCNLIMI